MPFAPAVPPSQPLVDQQFIANRHRLLELAAFLDRMDRHGHSSDYRVQALVKALDELRRPTHDRAERVQLVLSDPTASPIEKSPGKGASGAWQK
jgi:hypothetical protein